MPAWLGNATTVTALRMGKQMFLFSELKSVCSRLARRTRWARIFAGTALAACVIGVAAAQSPEKVPNLASGNFAWTPLTING